nr:hypothetical protein [Campylobacter sp.]
EQNTSQAEHANNIKSLLQSGISEITLQSGYVGNGAKVGANNGEISFDYKWFKSDNLDTIYEKDGLALNTASGRVRDINDAANDNPDLKQNIQDLKTNLIDKAFDDISLDMDNILEKWILNDNIFGKDLNLNESTNLANSFMSVRSNESFTANLKADENAETSSNNNTLINEANEKKIAIVEAYRGAKLSDIQKANPYIILGVLKEYDNIKFDAMKRIFAEQLFPSVSNCAQMLRALNNNLNRIVNSNATPQEIALSINLLAASLQRDYDYTIFHLTKVNTSPNCLTNPVIMNLLSKVGINFSISNGEITGIIGKHNFGNNESESYDFSDSVSGVNINAKGGNDIIIGSEFNDELIGENGNDIIFSGKGIDILRGGAGNDLLIGSDDTTIYEYYLGDGDDIIYDDGGVDILRFAFLKSDDINIVKNGDDMIINVSNPYDKNATIGSITIKNGLTSGKIEQYYFDDKIYSFDEFARLKGLVDDTPNTEPLNPNEPSDNPQPSLNHAPTLEKEYEKVTLNVSEDWSGYLGVTYTYDIYTGKIGATDIDGDKLSYKVLNPSENFVLNDDGSYVYTTTKDSKSEQIQVEVSDGKGGVAVKTLEFDTILNVIPNLGGVLIPPITLEPFPPNMPINHKPIIENKDESITLQVKIDERGEEPVYQCDTYTGKIIATDIDGDELNYKALTYAPNFVLNSDGTYTYTPTKDSLSRRIFVEVDDNKINGKARTTISFNIERYVIINQSRPPRNNAPTLEKEYEKIELEKCEDRLPGGHTYTHSIYYGNIGATDIDGDKLNYKVLNPSANFVLDDNGNYVFNTDIKGNSKFDIEVSDGKGGSVIKTLEFEVVEYVLMGDCDTPIPNYYNKEMVRLVGEPIPINNAPTLKQKSESISLQVKIDERGEEPICQCDTYTGKIEATDIDGDELSFKAFNPYTNKLSSNFVLNDDGSYTYTTTKDSYSETIWVTVSDNKGGEVIKELYFKVERWILSGQLQPPQNHTPILEKEFEKIDIDLSDKESVVYKDIIQSIDIDGDNLNFKVLNPSPNFTLYGLNRNYTGYSYTATKGNVGEIIQIEISDGKGGAIVKTLEFCVNEIDTTKSINETNANSEANFNKIANDLAFRFGENNFNKSSVNSSEFANSTNSGNSGYITANQMDKIIEQLNTYSDDKGLGNFAFNDMQNSVNLQIYG